MIFDTLENLEVYIPLVPQLRAVADAMDHDDIYEKECGRYTTPDKKVMYEVIMHRSSSADSPFCFHKAHTVVEIVLSGQELMSTSWRELQRTCRNFDESSDTGYFIGEPVSALQASQGRFALFLPGEPYKSGVSSGECTIVKKVVFTIED